MALRAAKEQARARGDAAQQKKQARRGGGLRSGARADGRDPMPLGAAINRLITERGWETPAAVGGVMGRWPQIVGEDLAKHCVPERYDEDERVLTVRCDSTAWATQLRLLAPQLVARLNEDLGHGTVRLIKVLGPGGPPPVATGRCGRRAARARATPTGDRGHVSGAPYRDRRAALTDAVSWRAVACGCELDVTPGSQGLTAGSAECPL